MKRIVTEMSVRKIIKAAFKERGVMQVEVAEKLGMLSSALSQKINRDSLSVETFRMVLNELGYDVVVTDRQSGCTVWRVSE